MSVLKVVVSGFIVLIGTGLLINSVAFAIFMNNEYPTGNSGVGNYLLILFVPSLIFIVLIFKKNVDVLIKIAIVYVLTAFTFFAYMYLDKYLKYGLSEAFFDFIGYKVNNSGSNWEKLKSIEVGFMSIILPLLLFIYSFLIYFHSRKTNNNYFLIGFYKDKEGLGK